ncbi:unnamed protein product [Urochloa decumbens]|uniref:F-box domain-containing protein n=1 Tax=Urochloa decumbens TaxID=240449 RepID=A0ABC9E4X6_9POAL
MAIDAAASGGEKKQRVDGQGDPSESVGVDAIPADPISALPDELRQRILTHLPLKDAISTGAVARGWCGLWRCRWAHRGSVELHLRSRDAPRIELDALECEPRPRRRLDRFSLVVDTCKLKSSELRRFVEYAAECRIEDLHVEVRKTTAADKLNFHLPLASPLLARLSLRRISISNMYYKGAQPFHALEVILLHSVSIARLCPNLLTLDLRGCDCEHLFFWGRAMDWPAKLRSVTVAECDGTIKLDLVRLPGFVYKSMESSLDVVPFLLRKAKSLQKLLIVSPNVTPPDVPGVQDEDLLFLKEALANGKIMLSESDDAATQPYHSEVFIEL